MKKQQQSQQRFHAWSFGSGVVFLILVSCSVSVAENKTEKQPGKEPIGVFLNNKQIHISEDSIEVTAKGIMVLATLSGEVQKKNALGFRIVIRKRILIGSMTLPNQAEQYATQDERYMDGKVFNNIEVEEILRKTKPGDQLIIVPIDHYSKYENSNIHFLINVIGDKC